MSLSFRSISAPPRSTQLGCLSSSNWRIPLHSLAAAVALPLLAIAGSAQDSGARNFAGAALPEAPSAVLLAAREVPGDNPFSSSSTGGDTAVDPGVAEGDQTPVAVPRLPKPPARASDITVLPGQVPPSQTVHDKLVGSVRDSISPFTLVGELISGGYSHLTNGSPNYGTNAGAFGQRFGAAVARGTSQNLFYEGAMASILHEDPRYYIQGSQVPFLRRVAYAATRPLITRTDHGHTTPNLALLSGYFGAAALTKVYYPPINQGFNQTLQTFGGSIGGAALGYIATEFLPDALRLVHLRGRD